MPAAGLAGLLVAQLGGAGEPIPLAAFAQLPLLRAIEISPDGASIAYLRPTSDGRQAIVTHPIDDPAAVVALPTVENAFIAWFSWVNDEQIAVSYRFSEDVRSYGRILLRDGTNMEQSRFLAFRADGADQRAPVELARPGDTGCYRRDGAGRLNEVCPPPLVQDNVVDWLEDDPRHMLLAVDDDLDGAFDVRRVDVRNGRYKVIRAASPDVSEWLTDHNGRVRFGHGLDDDNRRVGVLKRPNGDWEDVSASEWMQRGFIPHGFEKDARFAIAVGPVNGDTRAIVRLDLEGDRVVEVLHEHPEFDVFPRFHAGRMIGYDIPALDDEFVPTDPQWARLYEAAASALPGDRVQLVSWTPDEQIILVMASNPRDAGTLFLWDRRGGEMHAVGRSYPDLDPERLAPMEQVTYETRDGLEIIAYLTVPAGAAPQNLPVVVMPHGGPYSRDTLRFDFLVQAIASRGYAVLQPNFRGSRYQGRLFEESGKGEWGRKMQDDLTDGLSWLIDAGIADPQRACIVGWSYGGYAAYMGAIRTARQFRCAASINGVADLRRLRDRFRDPGYRRQYEESFGTDEVSIEQISPIERVDDVGIPLLIVHARDDGRVLYEDHAQPMQRQLERAGKEVTLVSIESGDHSLMNADARLRMLEALETFLAQHLGG